MRAKCIRGGGFRDSMGIFEAMRYNAKFAAYFEFLAGRGILGRVNPSKFKGAAKIRAVGHNKSGTDSEKSIPLDFIGVYCSGA